MNIWEKFVSERIQRNPPFEPGQSITDKEIRNIIIVILLCIGYIGLSICCQPRLTVDARISDIKLDADVFLQYPYVFIGFVLPLALWFVITEPTRRRRDIFLNEYQFPPELKKAIAKHYPQLLDEQLTWILEALRQYFQMCHGIGYKVPSKAVDTAWKEFIQLIPAYEEFCQNGLGNPPIYKYSCAEESLSIPIPLYMKKIFQRACWLEGIDPESPTRLPFIFAIDVALDIPNGFKHSLEIEYRIKPGESPIGDS